MLEMHAIRTAYDRRDRDLRCRPPQAVFGPGMLDRDLRVRTDLAKAPYGATRVGAALASSPKLAMRMRLYILRSERQPQ
jgi:hypothetical protein